MPIRSDSRGTTTTRERILVSAELLFAEHGFAGTSLRSITAHAGVNLAAIHYHFGSKEELIVEVLAQKVRPVNEERLRRLDELEAGPAAPTIEQILVCFVEPPLRAGGDPERSAALRRLITLFHHDGDPGLERRFMKMFYPTAERFGLALAKAGASHVSPEEVVWRLHFTIGALLYTMSHANRIALVLTQVRGGDTKKPQPEDVDETVRQLVAFLAGGFQSPKAKRKK